ncbi:amino acid permease [Pseudenhygromyxa sp. WMMC2535]|uniref:amino acid permease n=1 Tax=Pseudenhygromyxa sp. WMMC2535 TaxID=2712867 RepID=UPI001556611C|nr:amino acid permease [Pseudenhygromyxa sp. WMMC2535]NVB36888.1 amino acid permease [Pseudenhygromyxa sp. WMMC2535]
MAKKSTKFGTFGGVFTPSILTILGVIMYLRLPWVIGNAGLWVGLGVIAAAHVISVTTGLSISSIATDKKVGAGGPYYIVSRSLGLPIGGTLGLALFVGLSFSISLYVIGFCESFLAYWEIEPNIDNIRLYGTATIIGLTVVTLISTSFAIKTQYVIMGLIVASLVSILLSSQPANAELHLHAPEGGASIAEVFGIFFPAVTGFTAGVNMSGDLRDPKKAIPVGTMAAISVGLVTYVGLAVFLAWKVPVAEMLSNTAVLSDIAVVPIAVIGGVWGATLSSGLGSIMGAPRILQALASDRVMPVFLAKGHGQDNEPRRALVIAFLIGEAGILIGELDVIARVVSIFFIATYGFLNISCAIESWASTDFRPEFRIPRTVSVIGAATCMLMMVQLDIAATAAATLLFAGLFFYLKRRELALESGDTWEGVWSSLVRWGLEQLQYGSGGIQRNWRPNVIALSWRELDDRGPLLGFGVDLIRDRGVLTDFRLRTPKEARREQEQERIREDSEERSRDDVPSARSASRKRSASLSASWSASWSRSARASKVARRIKGEASDAPIAGLFERTLETEDPWSAAQAIARFHGFAGLEPNTVLMSWAEHRHDQPGFIATIDALVELDYNLLLLARDEHRDFGERERIDLWWSPGQGSFELGVALIRFLSLSDDWRRSKVRFLLLNDDPSRGDALFKSAQRALDDARVQAEVKVLNNAIGNRPLADWVRQESSEADLVVMGLPPGRLAKRPEHIDELDALFADIGSVIVCRAGSHFPSLLGQAPVDTRREISKLVPLDGGEQDLELAPLEAPEAIELAAAARELSTTHDELAREFHTDCLGLIYNHDAALIEQLRGVVERAFDQLGKALRERATLRQRKQLNKIQSGFLFQARRALSEFESDRLGAQVDAIERRVESWLEQLAEFERELPKTLIVTRDPAALAPSREDSPSLRRAKRRLRRRHLFQGAQLSYNVPVAPLYTYYLRWRSPALLEAALADMAGDAYQAMLELGRSISEARHALDEFALRLVELPTGEASERAKGELAARIDERRELVLARLDKLATRTRKQTERSHDLLMRASRTLAQSFADDIDRLDVHALLGERRLPKQAEALTGGLPDVAARWQHNRKLLLNRASLELHNAGFQHRLRAIVDRSTQAISQGIERGVLRSCEELRGYLAEARRRLSAAPEGPERDETQTQTQTQDPGQDHRQTPDQAGEASPGETEANPGLELLAKLKLSQELRASFDDKKVVEDLAREAQIASAELPDAIEVLGDDALTDLEEHPFEDSEVLTISLRRLVDFLVQAEFIDGLREHTSRAAMAEQRAVSVAQDVLHLISFNLSEYEHERGGEAASPATVIPVSVSGETSGAISLEHIGLADRIGPVVDAGLARLDGELRQLRRLTTGLAERIGAQLGKILDRTEAYAITGSEDSFKLYVRHDQGGGGALSRVTVVTRWAEALSKRALVALLYRWSASVVEARKSREPRPDNLVERTLAMVNASSPSPELLESLPFYYSQPFLAQARVSVEFWIGREQELEQIAEAIRNWRQDHPGALVIVGERCSGKTSLARFTARKHFDKRSKYSLLPPRGGSAELGLFKARLEKELQLSADIARDWDEILGAVPTGSVIMIHDLELWWERSPEGAAVIDKLGELIARWGDRLCFILELDVHAFDFLGRLTGIGDQALAVVECQPFPAEQLKELIEIRHRSTGLRYSLDEREEEALPAWNKARLFTHHFDSSGGYVGVALQSWITHIESISGDRLQLRRPSAVDSEVLAELRIEWVALLLQFIVHKRLTRARLARVTGLDEAGLERTLSTLQRAGLLVVDLQGTFEINRYVHHLVVAALRERGVL